MKKWNINALMMNDESTFDYDFKVNYEGHQVTLFDKTTLHDKWLYKYTSFCLSTPSFYDPGSESYIDTCPDIDAAITMLHALYTQWKADRGHSFAKTYAALMAEYNPLWNVDGVEGLIFKDTHTGTDTNAKSGKDTTQASGSDTDTLSGSDTYDKDITKEETTRTGNETIAKSGNDTDTRSVATFDSAGNLGPESSNKTDYNSTDTHTYNSVKDSHTLDAQDKTTYGKIDTLAYGKKDETTYGQTNTETRNLTDEHIEMKIRQGNIGVTKSTDLVESEISLRERLDHLIDYFIADFIRAYCIL